MFVYRDFELRIAQGDGPGYLVEVLHSPAGEPPHHEVMHLPFSETERREFLADLPFLLMRSTRTPRDPSFGEEQTVREFGRRLFDALLSGETGNRYRASQALLSQQGARMRLKLRLRSAELTRLPWEFLFDKELGDYVCLAHQTSIVRYLEVPQPTYAPSVEPPLRMLAMAASPLGRFQFDAGEERRRLADALRDAVQRGQVQVEWVEGQTLDALQTALRIQAWNVFYFVGHGEFDAAENNGYILLANDDRSVLRLSAIELGRLLDGVQDSLRLAVLNACRSAHGGERDAYSSVAATLTRHGLQAVLAMQSPLTERAAITFASEFFSQLAQGLPIDAAVVEARKMVYTRLGRTLEWGTPALYMRAPDGVLFRLQLKSESKPVEDDMALAFGDMEQLKRHKRRAQK
jgi:hypothetical protein